MHVGMVVLKAFDVDTRNRLDILQVSRQEDMKSYLVCAASSSHFLIFSLWLRPTVIGGARGFSDDLEISLLSERGGVP